MNRTKAILYIDVDGVLLVNEGPMIRNGRPVVRSFTREFLEYATRYFDCRWLTGWHYDGERTHLEELYETYLKPARVNRKTFQKIKPHDWTYVNELLVDKLQSIDPDEDFYIVDDAIAEYRIPALFRRRLIKIRPTRPNELKRIRNILRRIHHGKEKEKKDR